MVIPATWWAVSMVRRSRMAGRSSRGCSGGGPSRSKSSLFPCPPGSALRSAGAALTSPAGAAPCGGAGSPAVPCEAAGSPAAACAAAIAPRRPVAARAPRRGASGPPATPRAPRTARPPPAGSAHRSGRSGSVELAWPLPQAAAGPAPGRWQHRAAARNPEPSSRTADSARLSCAGSGATRQTGFTQPRAAGALRASGLGPGPAVLDGAVRPEPLFRPRQRDAARPPVLAPSTGPARRRESHDEEKVTLRKAQRLHARRWRSDRRPLVSSGSGVAVRCSLVFPCCFTIRH